MNMYNTAILTENKHVEGLKWAVVVVHETFPDWLPAGYSFPALPQIFNSSSEEKQSFPNILSQLRCEPATSFTPITSTQLTVDCVRKTSRSQFRPPTRVTKGESVKGNSCRDRSRLRYFKKKTSLTRGGERERLSPRVTA